MSKKLESAPNGRWHQKLCSVGLFSACLMAFAPMVSFPIRAQAQAALNAAAGPALATTGPWPGSQFRIREIRLLDSNRVLIRIAIQSSGKHSFAVKSINSPPSKGQGNEEVEPAPFSFDGAFLEEVETGARFPLEAPKRQDGYLGRRYIRVELGPGSSSTLATIFSLPAPKEGQQFRLHLPGALEPISKIEIPRSP